MYFDAGLIDLARKVANKQHGKKRDELHERVAEMASEFEAACVLSRGPDAGRATHWEFKAREVKKRIYRFVDFDGEDVKAVNRCF